MAAADAQGSGQEDAAGGGGGNGGSDGLHGSPIAAVNTHTNPRRTEAPPMPEPPPAPPT